MPWSNALLRRHFFSSCIFPSTGILAFLFNFFSFSGVTLGNKILQVSGVQLYNTAFVHCIVFTPEVKSPSLNFPLRHFASTKDLHQYLFSPPTRNLKRIFTFTKKRWQAKMVFCICLQWAAGRQHVPRSRQSGPSCSCRVPHPAPQHPSIQVPARDLKRVWASELYLDLCCASVR